jgi:hypothetical protein
MALYVSLGFKKFGDDKLVTFTNTVYQHMALNAQYKPLKAFVDDIKVKNDAFILGISNAAQGGSKLIEDKNALREALLQFLALKIARKLEDMAAENDDNSRIITDAGFEVRGASKSSKEPVIALDIPVLTAKNIDNKSGYATLNWKKILNAINYGIEFRKMGEDAWKNGSYNNSGEFTFTNLDPKTVYEFRICAHGANGLISDMSLPVTIFVS